MTVRAFIARTIVAVSLLTSTAQVLAHGMDITLESAGDQISGTVTYTNGDPGVGDFVSIANLTSPQLAPLEATTDATGSFAVTGVLGHAYVLTAYGEEGHTVTQEFVLSDSIDYVYEDTGIPFYVIAGILLLLSIFPARYFSNRGKRSA